MATATKNGKAGISEADFDLQPDGSRGVDLSVLREGRGATDVWTAAPINEHYSTIYGSPTLTLKCGEVDMQTSLVIVIIPGVPGVGHFYKDFMRHLHLLSRLPVWCICHAGHTIMPPEIPNPTCTKDLYELEGQVKHKYMYLRDHIEDHMRIVLIGHQIGAYICLELLKRLPKQQILRAMLLFPVIERTGPTDGAAHVRGYVSYGQWAVTSFMSMLSMTREQTVNYFIDWYYNGAKIAPCVRKGCQRLIDARVMKRVFKLLEEQIYKIKDADFDVIDRNIDRICFYYGTKDEWVPVPYCTEMKERYPNAVIALDPDGLASEFYCKTKSSKILAEQIWEWTSTAY